LLETQSHSTYNDKFKRVGDYYLSGMDTVVIEKAGYKSLVPHLEKINNLKTVDDILNEIAYERVNGISGSLIGIFIAQVWRKNTLPEEAAQRVLTDPHSPGLYRVNGPLPNIDAWYDAFDVKPGDKLYKSPEQRIKIW